MTSGWAVGVTAPEGGTSGTWRQSLTQEFVLGWKAEVCRRLIGQDGVESTVVFQSARTSADVAVGSDLRGHSVEFSHQIVVFHSFQVSIVKEVLAVDTCPQ